MGERGGAGLAEWSETVKAKQARRGGRAEKDRKGRAERDEQGATDEGVRPSGWNVTEASEANWRRVGERGEDGWARWGGVE